MKIKNLLIIALLISANIYCAEADIYDDSMTINYNKRDITDAFDLDDSTYDAEQKAWAESNDDTTLSAKDKSNLWLAKTNNTADSSSADNDADSTTIDE